MPQKRHTKTHQDAQTKSPAQTHFACDKAHYALETKLKTNDAGYIWVGIFARKLCAQTKRKPLKPVFLVQAATRFV